MKEYRLKTLKELSDAWDRQRGPVDWDLEESKTKIVEFFASGDQGRQLGEGEQKGTGVERGPAVEVSGNGPSAKERGNDGPAQNLDVHGR